MQEIKDVVILIPAYNPDEKFVKFVGDLYSFGYREIIVVNDGSKEECKKFFDTVINDFKCNLVVNNVNLGKGRALKNGFNYFLGKYKHNEVLGVIICDCDGQHIVEDITKCYNSLKENPNKLILGSRNFNKENIPFKSRYGNKITSFVFKFFCGIKINDTQTGLRAIPKQLIYKIIESNGERFEYECNMLIDTKTLGYEMLEVPINTIYLENNKSSHFNPIKDSIKIYACIFKYLFVSMSSCLVDLIFFSIFNLIFGSFFPTLSILISTYMARLLSSIFNFTLNKTIVFENKGNIKSTAIKYGLLCIFSATMSGLLVNFISGVLSINVLLIKIVVDTIIFFFNFKIQQLFIFKNKRD